MSTEKRDQVFLFSLTKHKIQLQLRNIKMERIIIETLEGLILAHK